MATGGREYSALGQEVADRIRKAVKAIACIAAMGRLSDNMKEQHQEDNDAYMKEYNVHYAYLGDRLPQRPKPWIVDFFV